jgi:hypothetical protein
MLWAMAPRDRDQGATRVVANKNWRRLIMTG